MKKLKSSQKAWLITFAVIIVSISLYIAAPYIFALLYDSGDNRDTVYYDDGTVVYHGNGPLYDHVLFDHYSVSHNGEGNCSIRRLNAGNDEDYDRDMINKFTFDKNGYIAYHVAYEPTNKNEYRLFSAEDESIQTFATMKELYDFCTENNIELGPWYHGLHLEQTHFDNNGWKLTTNSLDASFIRHNGEELFSGQIDKYFFTPRYLFFKFQHFDPTRYRGDANPVIPVDDSVSVGKRYSGFLFFFLDIHTEKYICIDTETDKYIIFGDEKSIEEYAASLGINQNWEKIKFNDKVNN